jgi:hypothetical protein
MSKSSQEHLSNNGKYVLRHLYSNVMATNSTTAH